MKLSALARLSVLPLVVLGPPALRAQWLDNQVELWAQPAAGQPGEEVTIAFRGNVPGPLSSFVIGFDLPEGVADFIRTDLLGTASSAAYPRGVVYDPEFSGIWWGDNGPEFYEGFLTGAQFEVLGHYANSVPGADLLLVKAVVRIRADAPAGEYPIHIGYPVFIPRSGGYTVTVFGSPSLRVDAPAGPRPVGDLRCSQTGASIDVSWTATEAYDSVRIERGGSLVAVVAPPQTAVRDAPPPGPASYRAIAFRDGKASLPATCEILVQEPRPKAPAALACRERSPGGPVDLTWTDPEAYDSIAVFRNGRLLAMLPGDARSFGDDESSDLFTVYSVRGRAAGVDGVPANCSVRALTSAFVFRAEDVRAEPGSRSVPIRIFFTNPKPIPGMNFGLRVDPAFAQIREVTADGTFLEAIGAAYFGFQPVKNGQTAVGILQELIPVPGHPEFPAGADQHIATVIVDVAADAPSGLVVPVQIGYFGDPPSVVGYTSDDGYSHAADARPGSILIGRSPVPEVEGARAEMTSQGPGGGAFSSGILLRWTNRAGYSAIRIERDGAVVDDVAGDATVFEDPAPGPGIHHYRVTAIQGGARSFPAVVTALPSGVPGTFIRGDADGDGTVTITDPIMLLAHLFLAGPQPACLDAADADDSGSVDLTDVLCMLYTLFAGTGPLPEPGPSTAWFDPTPDGLGCE